jgi:hypothetical protein
MQLKKNYKSSQYLAIQQVLFEALLLDGELFDSLYKYELEEHIDFWKEGLIRDKNDFIFVVTENNGHAAMLVITKKDELLINVAARDFIKNVWKKRYNQNIKNLLPSMVSDLDSGCFSLTGVTII